MEQSPKEKRGKIKDKSAMLWKPFDLLRILVGKLRIALVSSVLLPSIFSFGRLAKANGW